MRLYVSGDQEKRLRKYEQLLLRYNKNINLISRDDPGDFWDDHVWHSLQLLYRSFPSGSRVVDWGTGGGLPVIPLAVLCPDVQFVGVDAVRKKVQAVRAFVRRLELKNVDVWHGRAEEWQGKVVYSVSRATAPLTTLWDWHARVAIGAQERPGTDHWQPGLICLKGGDLTEEMSGLMAQFEQVEVEVIELENLVEDRTYPDKKIVAVHDKTLKSPSE